MTPTLRTISGHIIEDPAKGPTIKQVNIFDIAHALSQLCRFAGQFPSFYSVGAHSLLVSQWIERNGGTPEECLAGLLHDATEAYLADLPSPIKRQCKSYRTLEARYAKIIAKKFMIPFPLPEIVHRADAAILEIEKKAFREGRKMPWSNKNTRVAFIDRFQELIGLDSLPFLNHFRYTHYHERGIEI